MSLTVWSRFSDFSLEIIKLRSFYELSTLVAIWSRLDKQDQEQIFMNVSQKLLMEDVELYRWFVTNFKGFGKSPEEKAAVAEYANLNIAKVQKLMKFEKNTAQCTDKSIDDGTSVW